MHSDPGLRDRLDVHKQGANHNTHMPAKSAAPQCSHSAAGDSQCSILALKVPADQCHPVRTSTPINGRQGQRHPPQGLACTNQQTDTHHTRKQHRGPITQHLRGGWRNLLTGWKEEDEVHKHRVLQAARRQRTGTHVQTGTAHRPDESSTPRAHQRPSVGETL
jgi:hypothetical protein